MQFSKHLSVMQFVAYTIIFWSTSADIIIIGQHACVGTHPIRMRSKKSLNLEPRRSLMTITNAVHVAIIIMITVIRNKEHE